MPVSLCMKHSSYFEIPAMCHTKDWVQDDSHEVFKRSTLPHKSKTASLRNPIGNAGELETKPHTHTRTHTEDAPVESKLPGKLAPTDGKHSRKWSLGPAYHNTHKLTYTLKTCYINAFCLCNESYKRRLLEEWTPVQCISVHFLRAHYRQISFPETEDKVLWLTLTCTS